MLRQARPHFAALLIALTSAVGAAAQSTAFPPGSFRVPEAERALLGDTNGLYTFVDWIETPQGNDYWYQEAARVESGQAMSDAAAATVQAWLDAARMAETSEVPASFSAELATAALAGDPDALRSFVDWQDTPHGAAYWGAQYRSIIDGRGLAPLAERSIQNWIMKSAR